jgi:hypothetical protein
VLSGSGGWFGSCISLIMYDLYSSLFHLVMVCHATEI